MTAGRHPRAIRRLPVHTESLDSAVRQEQGVKARFVYDEWRAVGSHRTWSTKDHRFRDG